VDDKPKNALDWIRWARKGKDQADPAPPEAEPSAKPTHNDAGGAQSPPVQDDPPVANAEVATTADPAPARTAGVLPWEDAPVVAPVQVAPVQVAPVASTEPAVPAQAPVQDPPAPPTRDIVDEFDEFDEDLGELDDFDRLMADTPLFDALDEPAPAPPAGEPQLPAASNSTVFVPTDSAYAFAASDFNFVETNGCELTHVEIIALAGDGSLRFDHADVTMGQKISKADIDSGKFIFIPATARSSVSHDSFLYKVHGGETSSRVAYTMTIKALPDAD